jgi:hypothetical protein
MTHTQLKTTAYERYSLATTGREYDDCSTLEAYAYDKGKDKTKGK